VCLLGCESALAEEPFFEQITALPRRGIGPQIVLLEDGRLFLAGTRAVFSSDHGKTWSNPVKVPCAAGSIVVAKGRIIRFGLRITQNPDGVVTGSEVLLSSSTDSGRTWSDPEELSLPHRYKFTAGEPSIAALRTSNNCCTGQFPSAGSLKS